MLGNIISTDGNKIIIDLKVDINKIHNLINLYVIMEDDDKKFVGEIIDIKGNNAIISLLGELIDDKFVFGIMSKPAFSAKVKLISKEKAPLIIGINNYEEDRHLYIGESPIYENVKIGKAGRTRHMGIRPTVRGTVMNPVDHPHGGGEGKAPVGHAGPMTPWGKPALGYKTRKKNKKSDKFIVKRRK